MLSDIRQFYDKTKLSDNNAESGESPITHVHVFHKEYPRLARTALPDTVPPGELFSLLFSRESSRIFSGKPIPLDMLAIILRSCGLVDPSRQPEKRTYPSAGARFPVEVYAIAFNVEAVRPGAYHYNFSKHCLELLLEADLADEAMSICSPYVENPAAALVFTAAIARSEVKYGIRSFPYSLIEAGHMCQNVHLACTKLCVGSCPIGGFVNDAVSDILDLTDNELPLYTIGIGMA